MRALKSSASAITVLLLTSAVFTASAKSTAPPAGWTTAAPRDEIKPEFSYHPAGGPDHRGSFTIESDRREGLQGRWTRTFDVQGGQHYRFVTLRKVTNADGRRTAVARILWQDAKGKPVTHDEPSAGSYQRGVNPRAEPEYPMDGATDAHGWTEVSGVYRAPSKAVRAVVELEFRWAPRAKIEWTGVAIPQGDRKRT